jgi:hypothetical protein
MRGARKETAPRRTVSNLDELWSRLEDVRRSINTTRLRIEMIENPDFVPAATAQLELAEATEQDLLRQLAGIETA